MSKPKYTQIVTPPGVVKFAHVGKPNTRFNPDGEYSVDLILDPNNSEDKALIDRLQAASEKSKADAIAEEPNAAKKKLLEKFNVRVPFQPETDKEGNETGMVVLKAKNKAKVTPKGKPAFDVTIKAFDAKQKELTDKNIGRGSKVRVAALAVPYVMPSTKEAGITLRLTAVQVLDFVPIGGGQNADDFGFGEEEGYTAETNAFENAGETSTDNGGDF
jgi:hypothetical protein